MNIEQLVKAGTHIYFKLNCHLGRTELWYNKLNRGAKFLWEPLTRFIYPRKTARAGVIEQKHM